MSFPNASEKISDGPYFWRSETQTVQSGLVVRWEEKGRQGSNNLEISASRDGVMLQGYSSLINSPEKCAEYKRVLDLAWQWFAEKVGR